MIIRDAPDPYFRIQPDPQITDPARSGYVLDPICNFSYLLVYNIIVHKPHIWLIYNDGKTTPEAIHLNWLWSNDVPVHIYQLPETILQHVNI